MVPNHVLQYNLLYQDLKRFSKNGECFCKELITVFQQSYSLSKKKNSFGTNACSVDDPIRSELEISYSKTLQKLAGKLINVSKMMSSNSTYNTWSLVSNEMFVTAEAHRTLGQAFQHDASVEIRQLLDEHTKRKRPLENAIEKAGKLVLDNWNEQLKAKKKLAALTREHEALFNFVEKNKHICTEKEKQKMINRLTKSAELQVKEDERYFSMNMDSHQIRLKWENTLKSCYQIVQDLEKQRIETLFNALNKYSLHTSSYSQTLLHSQKQVDQAISRVDVEKDVQTLLDDTCVTADDNQAEFLMTDYYEEDGKTAMEKERRKAALKAKLQRLEECILKTKKDKEGLEMMKSDSETNSNTIHKNLEETEQLIDESILKLELLEATYCKLNQALMEVEGKPKPVHRFTDGIKTFKEKDCEHSIVKLSRPVRMKKTPFRSRQSLRTSVVNKGSAKNTTHCQTEINGASPHSPEDITQAGAEFCRLEKCEALYDYSSEKQDELNITEGDQIEILQKEDSGWWFGEVNGKKGFFPSNYVKELPVIYVAKSSDA
ncbi:nostrin [Trichomycterus rosablanca]|uniref:nostrin n=1 Tax=Trichomycterus rosablanca TaxID=2290929 RepID=UPI002F35C207